jgi:hypothetical protein
MGSNVFVDEEGWIDEVDEVDDKLLLTEGSKLAERSCITTGTRFELGTVLSKQFSTLSLLLMSRAHPCFPSPPRLVSQIEPTSHPSNTDLG